MKNTIILLMIGIFSNFCFCQELYIPRNIKRAYENGTRSNDGLPGKSYWQNHGVYDMQIKLIPAERKIIGQETIHYSNNSPDTLRELVIRFVNNIHKPNAPRGYYAPNDFLDSGLTISHLSIDGNIYQETAKNWGTVGRIKLKKAILPHSSVDVEMNWSYPLSKKSGREGQINPTTFFAAYSYPRISVYDDYNGWDVLDHTGRQEFYNDFNDYTFSISVPKNYIVYATGMLKNPEEVLQSQYAERLSKSHLSDSVVHIVTAQDLQSKQVTKQQDWLTWKFSAQHISDVCFAVSDNYVWDASSVIVDSKTNRRVSVQAAYVDTALDFKQYVKWARFSLDFFSKDWPGVPFPFPKMTAFQGFADMEYPMMVNDGTEKDLRFARLLQDHEMLHSYFPFYMGINETRYAFMDEGWATAFEYLVGIAEFGQKAADEFFKEFRSERYIWNTTSENDQQMITQSSQQAGMGYGSNSYGKAALSYLSLKDLLGDSIFKKALHFYMNSWNGKHPIPWDYFNCFNQGSGQNLNWFFQNWFFSYNYIDLKLNKINCKGNKCELHIENVGGFAIPFDIVLRTKDNQVVSRHYTPAIWKTQPKGFTVKMKAKGEISSVTIDNGIYVDATPKDNFYKVK